MKPASAAAMGPPRLLLGVALLFWGGVTGHPLVGLLCAFVVEARFWTDLRWSFGERGFVRAWALALLLGILTLTWFWFQGNSLILLFDLLVWMPVFLLPVLLAQLYATQPSMALNTFSFIARRKMLMDRAAGRPVDPIQIHVGYPYLCLLLVASALSRINDLVFFIGLIFLMALILFAASPSGRKRPYSWSLGLVLVAVLGGSVAIGLTALFNFLGGTVPRGGGIHSSPDSVRTAIGHLGRIKQSYRIYWRVEDRNEDGPRLFREAVYNRYGQGQWAFKPVANPGAEGKSPRQPKGPPDDPEMADSVHYEEMYSDDQPNGEKSFAFERLEFDRMPDERFRLTIKGGVETVTPLPLPDSTQRLSGLRVRDGGVDYNELGTIRLINPDESVASIEVHYGGPSRSESKPSLEADLQVPPDERPGIARVVDEWGLREVQPREAMRIIQERFVREFEYTMHLSWAYDIGPSHGHAVTKFLTVPTDGVKSGHCEYFATAAVLLLREAGIPARYCVGFSAQERSERSGEWLLRGRHAHAWVRVSVDGTKGEFVDSHTGEKRRGWTDGTWIDFDPTPPGWFEAEGSGLPWRMKFLDWWQRVREDFLLWRTTPGNRGVVNLVMGIVSALLITYVTLRLWHSRTRTRRGRGPGVGSREVAATPLHALARSARHWLGPRPEAQTFTAWILQLRTHLPAIQPSLQRAVSYHWKARFDPIGLDPAEEREFADLCRDLKVRLKEVRRGK